MTTLEEFKQEVAEIREKIDLEKQSVEKNRTFLQLLKELCAKTFEEPNLDTKLETEVKKVLFDTENDLAKIKKLAPTSIGMGFSSKPKQSEQTSEEDRYRLQPIKQELSSVSAGAFDPNSSPILRRLKQKTQQSALKNSASQTNPSNDLAMNTKNSVNIQEKQLKSISLDPFPSITPFPQSELESSESSNLKPAHLEIPQLKIKIPLTFSEKTIRIGRQDIENLTTSTVVPEHFFDPILTRQHEDLDPSEHFIIEQPESGSFLIADRNNQQKTYFKNQFIGNEGITINEGDTFILPVSINQQLSSLTIIFHVGEM